jgi:CHAD domain-containing protein
MKPIDARRLSAEVRGALCNEIADALQALWQRRRPSDQALHQVRKDLKRARAALRLLREAVGEAAYAHENLELRDAARPLARVRDATVALEIVRELLDSEGKPARREKLIELRRELNAERLHAREQLLRGHKLARIEYALQDAGERAEYWRFPLNDAPVLRVGFERVYRKGRKALKKARAELSAESLHETRKQVKYLQQALAMVADGEARGLKKLARRAEAVAERLGDDHDLAGLEARLAELRTPSRPQRKLIARLEARRAKLQKKAPKPAAFADKVLAP